MNELIKGRESGKVKIEYDDIKDLNAFVKAAKRLREALEWSMEFEVPATELLDAAYAFDEQCDVFTKEDK